MKCLFPRRESRPGKHRFSWGFLSLGSRQTTGPPASPPKPRALSDPCIEPRTLSESSSQRPPELRVFSFAELKAATKNFSRADLLGEGGFGCVYKGFIKQENTEFLKEVAIKQLNRKGQQGHKEWLAEVRFLGLVEHPNLVKLVGYCAEDDERGIQRLLVYEFMSNKSLEEHLFQKGPSSLTWEKRLHILLGAGRGLAYLHEGMNDIQVIFRDFKTSNVLLDENFSPKLSDFGLAREGPETGFSHVSTAVVGTIGYVAPEYFQTGHLTAKSDVWSFGVVMLEMLSGKRSVDKNRPKDEQKLLDWVKPYLQGNKKIHNVIDPQLAGQYSMLQAQRIASLALQCLAKQAKTRPAMSVVVEKLREIIELPTTGSLPSERDSTRSSSNWRNLHVQESRGAEIAKRRRLIFKDIMSLKSRDEARQALQGWAQKAVPA